MRTFFQPILARLCSLSAVLTAGLLMPCVLSAQSSIWTGEAASVSPFDPFNSFVWNGNWQGGNAPIGATSRALVFGAASYYSPYVDDNNGEYYRVSSLTFNAGAEEYTFSGDQLVLLHNSSIVNNSGVEQTFLNAFQFGTAATGNITATINTGTGGIIWTGGSTKTTSGTVTLNKTGLGALTLAGTHTGIYALNIQLGQLILDASYDLDLGSTRVRVSGGEILAIGESDGTSIIEAGSFEGVTGLRRSRIVVDPNGGEGTTLVFSSVTTFYGGMADTGADPARQVTTLHYDLTRAGSAVHFDAAGARLGPNNVSFLSTVTDASGKSGFAALVANPDGGYDLVRLNPTTVLPTTASSVNGTTNYYVELAGGTHTVTGTGAATPSTTNVSVGTLTLKGHGTLHMDNTALRAPNLLLEEGEGDFTLTGDGILYREGTYGELAFGMHMYSFRDAKDGALIIATDNIGFHGDTPAGGPSLTYAWPYTSLTTAGPGTIIIRSPNSYVVKGVFVQEGRLQVESDAFTVTALVNVYDGILGGSGQIGGGDRWVMTGGVSSGTASINGIRYTPVTITYGGTIDATPVEHATLEDLRGLQIHGSLTMEAGSTFAMTLNNDVLSGNYDPLHVKAENTANTVVTLTGDLQLTLDKPLTGALFVILLSTDGVISGQFQTINGEDFGPDNFLTLSFGDNIYDAWLQYDYDLGAGVTGVVLYAIPEPSTIALLAGLALAGIVWFRRRHA